MGIQRIVLVCFVSLCTLFILSAEGHTYTIIANAGTGGAIAPAGNVSVPAGADKTFAILPDMGHEISDVVTDSVPVGQVSSYTFTDVSADHTISAYFDTCADQRPVWFQGTAPFDSVTAAYGSAAALSNFILVLRAGALQEDLVFDKDVSVVLDGGYNCDFTDNYMTTRIEGSLIISAGTVTASNIVLTNAALCEPGDPNNNPDNPEICDCQDNNCNGLVDDGLTFDADGDGYTAVGSCGGSADDCNDSNPAVHPYGEIYGDGIDQDCDGRDIFSATSDAACFGCHSVSVVNTWQHIYTSAPDNTCAGCHAAVVDSIIQGHYGQTVQTAGNNMTAGSVIRCTSCHDWHEVSLMNVGNANIVWAKVSNYWNINQGYAGMSCDTCHENRAASHATGTAHDHRVIDSSCGQCHTSDTTVLGQPGTGTLTTQADVDALHRSDCSLCHAYSGTKICGLIVEQAIEQGLNGADIGCTACHSAHHSDANNNVSYDPAVDTSQDPPQGCADCHHDYDIVNGTSVGLGTWEAILVEHDLDGNKDGSANACSTCHAYGGSGSPPLSAVLGAIEGSGPDTCASCHTDKVPDTIHGIPTSGKHPEHFEMANMSCSVCHNTGNIPYFKTGDDTNGDGRYTLDETDVCDLCHQDGSGNPATDEYKAGWHDPDFVLVCGSCHRIAPSSGSHAGHFGAHANPPDDIVYGDLRITQDFSAGQVSSVNLLGCGNCHPLDLSLHGNQTWGDVELANGAAPADSLKALSPDGSYDQETHTCSNVYCHSGNAWTTDGPVSAPWPETSGWKLTDPLPRPLPDNIVATRVYQVMTWGSPVGQLTCNGCHANPPQTSSVDNDGGGGDSHNWVDPYGYQDLHISNMGFEPIGCRTCHYNTVQEWDDRKGYGWNEDPVTFIRSYNDVAIYDKAKHVNGSVDVAFDTVNNFEYFSPWSGTRTNIDLSPASFDTATRTCSNVACHIEETSVTWGLPYRWYNNTECDRCHGQAGGIFGPVCSDCHGTPE